MKNVPGKKGSALVLVLITLVVLTSLGTGFLMFMRTAGDEAFATQERTQAFWLAESGLRHFQSVIALRITWLHDLGLVGDNILTGSITNAGVYAVSVEDAGSDIVSGEIVRTYRVTSQGVTAGGRSASVASDVLLWTYMDNIVGSHTDGSVWYTTGDILGEEGAVNGLIFCNDYINILADSSPIFYCDVYSAQSEIDYGNRVSAVIDPEIFRGNVFLGVAPADFSDLRMVDIVAEATVTYGRGEYSVEFRNDEYVLTNPSGVVTTHEIGPEELIYFEGDVEVFGNVGETVSVAADGIIEISDDIVYSSSIAGGADPREVGEDGPNGSVPDHELLGLYSGEGIEITKVIVNSNTDICIHAAMVVLGVGNGFGVAGVASTEQYKNYGAIYLYGSLSQHTRGVVAYTRSGMIYGFLKNYRYDPRFENLLAPGMLVSHYLFTNYSQQL